MPLPEDILPDSHAHEIQHNLLIAFVQHHVYPAPVMAIRTCYASLLYWLACDAVNYTTFRGFSIIILLVHNHA